MSLCTFGNSKYLNEFGGQIELLSPKSSYEINIKDLNKKDEKESIIKINCNYMNFNFENIPPFILIENYFIKISKDEGLIIVIIKNKNIQNNKQNILYCHENNTDIGEKIPFLIDLSIQFKSTIVSFDYSGFGKSTGKKNKNKLISNSNLIIKTLLNNFKISCENLIVIGREIGAISALNICNRYYVKCLILLCPVFMDMIDKKIMNNIETHTFLIQGKVCNPFYNYQKISNFCQLIKNESEWSCKLNSFDKILEIKRAKFIHKIRNFLNTINNKSNKSSICISRNESDITLPFSGMDQKNESEIDLNCTYSNIDKNFKNNKNIVIFSDEEED